MKKYPIVALLLPISIATNCMEPIETPKDLIRQKSTRSIRVQNIKELDELLTVIHTKENLVIPPITRDNPIKEEDRNSLMDLRRDLNTKLESLHTIPAGRQFSDINTYVNQLNHYKTTYPIAVQESQQAHQLADRGLLLNKYMQTFPEFCREYELMIFESSDSFENIKKSYPSFMDTLKSSESDSDITKNIKESHNLLTEIMNIEQPFSDQPNTQPKEKTVNNLKLLVEKLYTKLTSFKISIYDQQFADLKIYVDQLHTKNKETFPKEIKSCVKEHCVLLQAQLAILQELQQTKQLTERGLQLFNEFRYYPNWNAYNATKNNAKNYLNHLKTSYSSFINRLQSCIDTLVKSQDTLSSAQSDTTENIAPQKEHVEQQTIHCIDAEKIRLNEKLEALEMLYNNGEKIDNLCTFITNASKVVTLESTVINPATTQKALKYLSNHLYKNVTGKEIEAFVKQKGDLEKKIPLTDLSYITEQIEAFNELSSHTQDNSELLTIALINIIQAINRLCIEYYDEQLANNIEQINKLEQMQQLAQEKLQNNNDNFFFVMIGSRCKMHINMLHVDNELLNKHKNALLAEPSFD
jgi:hypothetical protein